MNSDFLEAREQRWQSDELFLARARRAWRRMGRRPMLTAVVAPAEERGVEYLGWRSEDIMPKIPDYNPALFEASVDDLFVANGDIAPKKRVEAARPWRSDQKVFAAKALRRQRRNAING